MSHYFALVVAPSDSDPDAAVAEAMAPHEEKYDEARDRLTGYWDWWQIGGRWTGVLSDYDPAKDLANIRTCDLCGGTGDRATFRGEPKENQHPSGCNGCEGKGASVQWPTQWRRHEGDVATAAAALAAGDEAIPFALVIDGEFHVREKWNGESFDEREDWAEFVRERLQAAGDTRVIVVDYHS